MSYTSIKISINMRIFNLSLDIRLFIDLVCGHFSKIMFFKHKLQKYEIT